MGLLGDAVDDFYRYDGHHPLWVDCNRAPRYTMPVQQFFGGYNTFEESEKMALELCKGRVLDIGAGAGRHSLYLQNVVGLPVTALEPEPKMAAILREVGVRHVVEAGWQQRQPLAEYETILGLWNGLGLCGAYKDLHAYLTWMFTALVPGGQVLVETTSVTHLSEPKDASRKDEVRLRFEFKAVQGPWFTWLFADIETGVDALRKAGFAEVRCLLAKKDSPYLLTGTKPLIG